MSVGRLLYALQKRRSQQLQPSRTSYVLRPRRSIATESSEVGDGLLDLVVKELETFKTTPLPPPRTPGIKSRGPRAPLPKGTTARGRRGTIRWINNKIAERNEILGYMRAPPPASKWEVVHPWPQWIDLMETIFRQGFFHDCPVDFLTDKLVQDGGGDPTEGIDYFRDFATLHNAFFRFGEHRFDIFRNLTRDNIQAIVVSGCPINERSVAISAKRLRAYANIDEAPVCTSCKFRNNCQVAFSVFREPAQTTDVMQLLLIYGLDPLLGIADNKLHKKKIVKASICKLLEEIVALSATPLDPDLPKPNLTIPKPEPKPAEAPPRRKKMLVDIVDMKLGDWLCPKCDFLNFAANSICLKCVTKRPERDLNVGEWECPECAFVNFSRNKACYKCNYEFPEDMHSYNMRIDQDDQDCVQAELCHSEGNHTTIVESSNMFDVSRIWNKDFEDDELDGLEVATFEYPNRTGQRSSAESQSCLNEKIEWQKQTNRKLVTNKTETLAFNDFFNEEENDREISSSRSPTSSKFNSDNGHLDKIPRGHLENSDKRHLSNNRGEAIIQDNIIGFNENEDWDFSDDDAITTGLKGDNHLKITGREGNSNEIKKSKSFSRQNNYKSEDDAASLLINIKSKNNVADSDKNAYVTRKSFNNRDECTKADGYFAGSDSEEGFGALEQNSNETSLKEKSHLGYTKRGEIPIQEESRVSRKWNGSELEDERKQYCENFGRSSFSSIGKSSSKENYDEQGRKRGYSGDGDINSLEIDTGGTLLKVNNHQEFAKRENFDKYDSRVSPIFSSHRSKDGAQWISKSNRGGVNDQSRRDVFFSVSDDDDDDDEGLSFLEPDAIEESLKSNNIPRLVCGEEALCTREAGTFPSQSNKSSEGSSLFSRFKDSITDKNTHHGENAIFHGGILKTRVDDQNLNAGVDGYFTGSDEDNCGFSESHGSGTSLEADKCPKYASTKGSSSECQSRVSLRRTSYESEDRTQAFLRYKNTNHIHIDSNKTTYASRTMLNNNVGKGRGSDVTVGSYFTDSDEDENYGILNSSDNKVTFKRDNHSKFHGRSFNER